MASILTTAGENIFALKQAQGQVLNLDRFVLAYIPGLNPELAIDSTEGMPAAENIVHTHVIPEDRKGYVNPNQVVYSLQLTSDIGDFTFNWVGLLAEDDTVVAITHLPELDKWRNVPAENKVGNALIRNIMLEYVKAKEITNITVEASTWQIDWNVRLKGLDERERLSNFDIYGTGCFFADAFLVVNNGGSFSMQPGTAYVSGIRINLAAPQPISPALPADVYLDVSLTPTGSDVQPLVAVTYTSPGSYVDGVNVIHFGQKIAEIAADGTVTDVRPKGSGALLTMLGSIYALLGHVHDEYALVDHEHGGYAALAHTHLTANITDLLNTSHSWAQAQTYAPMVLPIAAGAVIWDVSATPVAVIVLTEDITGLTVHNAVVGGSYELTLIQDGTGGRTMSWPASWLWPGGVAPDVSTDPLAEDIIHLTTRSAGGDAVAVRATVAQAFAGVA